MIATSTTVSLESGNQVDILTLSLNRDDTEEVEMSPSGNLESTLSLAIELL